jgi:peroxiredoxin
VQSHKKFKEKAGLPFALLSDPKKEVARKFHNLRVRKNGSQVFTLIGGRCKRGMDAEAFA